MDRIWNTDERSAAFPRHLVAAVSCSSTIGHHEPPSDREREHPLQASTRLPASTTPDERSRRIDWLIKKLDLDERAGEVIGPVGDENLSGGQMKRVSLAMELSAGASVLHLDEPVSAETLTRASSFFFVSAPP